MHWKEKIVYQIWPRSFADSNGDGIGDLRGIISKLDYLKELGIDLIWLSPVYLSPNKDYGYDISDYYQINPEYGSMQDFDEFLKEVAARGMEVVMDLVANHTSDQHIWFKKALQEENSPYRDFYIFKKGKGDRPPNNWMSFFGGSAWTYEAKSKSYYMTQFTPNQCDLNWENPAMRQEIYKIMTFWLEKGVAGFRMDVINAISKAEGFPDVGSNPKILSFPGELTLNRPKTHTYIKEMYKEVLEPYSCIAIGEGPLAKQEDVVLYTREDRKELQMMFHFDLHHLGYGVLGKYDFRKLYHWSIKDFKRVLFSWQITMEREGGWTGNYLSNHDQNRQVSRFGDDKRYWLQSAKALALLNLTLRGTPFLYQGEEIGMTDCILEEGEWQDYEALNAYKVLQEMMHLPKWLARRIVKKVTRDNSRTTMQWDASENGGFSKGIPWTKTNPNYKTINVANQEKKPHSILSFYRELISFRKQHPDLTWGSFEPLLEEHPQLIVYKRKGVKEKYLVIINLSSKKIKYPQELEKELHKQFLLGNYEITEPVSRCKPYEARLYKI
ncbi:glucohydrolase [Sporanaerobium hydrogeniformans]|uniref:Glucohydrolase n=1 Tax=Sporanaerobium hydrogeniformans TaxID=3072179 RepID=A0AC61DEZ9_9FIRM|nr:alpha-glucosidase [Sporanaerobium hydrogeniformans]PHV71291.1 glucohydrolase [Sporanaerobium hydrogeniformans]